MGALDTYYENTQKPWGKLFYELLWNQLSFADSIKVLDFGSGFGITSNHLAKFNELIAVEPNDEMCNMSIKENTYEQIIGGLDYVKNLPKESFDLILCHNVMEYIDNKDECIATFSKLLKKGGKLSLVKHNHVGRTMQRVVFENNFELAINEMEGQSVFAQNFGKIKYYHLDDVKRWESCHSLRFNCLFGIRTFFGLIQNNEIKFDVNWQNKMLELEVKVSKIEEFQNIAFYHHIILEKMITVEGKQ